MRTCHRRLPGIGQPLLWAGSLPVPADAKVVDQRPAVEQERVYPMGPMRKISGRLRVEDKVESRGQVSSVTYDCRSSARPRSLHCSAREALQRTAATRCSGARAAIAARQPVGQRVFANARSTGRRATGVHPACAARPRRPTPWLRCTASPVATAAPTCMEEFVAGSPLGEMLPTAAAVLRDARHRQARLP
jgi:hypothetical protein